jgi:multidrug efflux pump subunit AcrA (membrane-fusion protein)
MGTTPTYGLPYPELDEPDNVPADMRELAEAVEVDLTAEAGARQAVDGRVTAEANARAAADSAEATARANADTAERNERIAADTAESTARANGDVALDARVDVLEATDPSHASRLAALEARYRSIGGIATVDFNDGGGRLNYPAGTGGTIGGVACNADSRLANAWISVIGSDSGGLNLYGWNSAGNVPLTVLAAKIAWVATVV